MWIHLAPENSILVQQNNVPAEGNPGFTLLTLGVLMMTIKLISNDFILGEASEG